MHIKNHELKKRSVWIYIINFIIVSYNPRMLHSEHPVTEAFGFIVVVVFGVVDLSINGGVTIRWIT
jgi:hypothetical protein